MTRPPIDYGPEMPSATAGLIDRMRETMACDRRLLMAKLIARTVTVDGDPAERLIAALIDDGVTRYFRDRYPEDPR